MKRLTAIHDEVANLLIQKKTYKYIAAKLNISQASINAYVQDPEFKMLMEARRNILREAGNTRMVNMVDAACDTIEESMKKDNKSSQQIKCAELTLKFAGLDPTQKHEIKVEGEIVNLTLEEKKTILLAKLQEEVIDDVNE